jgi:hypothetical protein
MGRLNVPAASNLLICQLANSGNGSLDEPVLFFESELAENTAVDSRVYGPVQLRLMFSSGFHYNSWWLAQKNTFIFAKEGRYPRRRHGHPRNEVF